MADYPVKNVDEWRNFMLRNLVNRNPDIDPGPDGGPYVQLSAVADALAIQSQFARAISRSIPLEQMDEAQVQQAYGDKVPRQLESKARGYVTFEGVATGATIQVGDTLTHTATKNRYVVSIVSNTVYLPNNQIQIVSVDPGAGQGLPMGSILTWDTPRPGSFASCKVADVKGLTGGRAAESLDEWKLRIRSHNANPASHGNEGDIMALIEDISGRTLPNGDVTLGHGVPVLKAFLYPALRGPGTCGYTFFAKPEKWFKSRASTTLELSTVFQYVRSALPKDFSLWSLLIVDEPAKVDISLSLDRRSAQWANLTPWPTYTARGAGHKVIKTVTSASAFSIGTDDDDYTGETAPSTGTVIGLYSSAYGTIFRKQIKTVTGAGPWTITTDDTAGLSDTTYVPVAGQSVSPWSDVLPFAVTAAGEHIAKLGPGEAVAYPSGDGVRRARTPEPVPGEWDDRVTARIAYDITSNAAGVSDATLVAASPTVPSVTGTLITVKALTLSDIGIFKS